MPNSSWTESTKNPNKLSAGTIINFKDHERWEVTK